MKKIIKPKKGKLELVVQLITSDVKEAEEFYAKALKLGNEGVMMKNLEAEYKPGSRVGYGIKIKPILEPLDLVIVGAEWGSGKRAGWLSSFELACKSKDEFLSLGKMGTGIKEKEEMGVSFMELTKELKKDIIETEGRSVKVKPRVVVEVGYGEIQKSPTYNSGYALRFPKLLHLRNDKPTSEVDTLKRVKRLYAQQRK